MKNQFKVLCGVVALVVAGQVSADTTWTLTSATPGLTVSAYANTGGIDNAANAANNGALQTIQSATVNVYSGGIGITNADAGTGSYNDNGEGVDPEHAIDNDQRFDMALLSFTSSVKLTSVKLGWYSNDSDITVMAYTGIGDPTSNGKLTGNTYDQLVGLGWKSIGNYSDVGTTSAKSINAGGEYSSYWLIGAYNPLAAGTNDGWSIGNDNIKLASVTGVVKPPSDQKVPEPGSMALFGVALVGLFGLRRQQKS